MPIYQDEGRNFLILFVAFPQKNNYNVVKYRIENDGDSMTQTRKRLVFHGRVQGVGFRYKAKYLASSLGLTGWVRNEYDGTVHMEVQGPRPMIYKLMEGLNRDRYIVIEWIDEKDIPVAEDERSFSVR